MQITVLKSKIHRATITGSNLQYEGSITIDNCLLNSANIIPYEQVHVVNVTNGSRLITYAISSEAGTGDIILNGAAARLGSIGDIIIIIAYCSIDEDESQRHIPKVVCVDSKNRFLKGSSNG